MPARDSGRLFRIGLTRDFLRPDGTLAFSDIGLSLLDQTPGVQWDFLKDNTRELTAEQVKDYDALLVLGPHVTAAAFSNGTRLALVARFGVGYDNVDVQTCTRHGVMLTITPEGVRRPVAVAALTLLLALSHKLLIKDHLTRTGRWAERTDHMGMGLTGRTLGVVGLGNIGQEVLRLAAPLEMTHLGCDPYVAAEDVHGLNVALVELEELLRNSDFVIICCSLTEQTRNLISGERIRLMKPTSYLINVARGAIVDQQALVAVLQEQRIQGAGLDVFVEEPIDPGDPLLTMPNVIVTPHALCWTDECFANSGRSAIRAILDVAQGRVPQSIVNRTVLDNPLLREKLARFRENWETTHS